MRLNTLELTRYGRFTNRTLTFNTPAPQGQDLHIIYGPNEAGKSTLFSAFTDLLFGIPMRTRYSFLHDGPTLQIGAELCNGAGGARLFRRAKRGLLDAQGTLLPETELGPFLGGLSRESYAAMFSLDDDTLEKGGDGILASQGDLGEMLFSASAGLASLTPQLKSLRDGLDAFHRKGKRSGWLSDAKKELAELERQRKETEVSAAGLRRLQSDLRQAELDWTRAREAEEFLQADVERLQRLEATLPLMARRAALELRLAPLADLPNIRPEQRTAFEALNATRLRRIEAGRDRDLRIEGLRAELAALVADPQVLALSTAITAAEALRADHEGALRDLPRRRNDLDDIMAKQALIAAELGAAPEASEPALASTHRAALRGLLARQSGIEAEAAQAAQELARAREKLAQAEEDAGDLASSAPSDEAALAGLIQRLTAQDPVARVALARNLRDDASANLTRALAALQPWSGDVAALNLPTDWQLTAWEANFTRLRDASSDLTRREAALKADIARLQSDLAEPGQTAGWSLAEAAALRARREALWAAHRTSLTLQSAEAYEQALREDDRVSAALAEALAGARRQAEAGAALANAQRQLAELQEPRAQLTDEEAALRTEFNAAILAGPGASFKGASPTELRRWVEAAQQARAAATRVLEQTAALDQALTDQRSAETALRAMPGLAEVQGGYEPLYAAAIARLQASERREEARRRLRELNRDLLARARAAEDRATALATWKADWLVAIQGSWLARYPDTAPERARVLDLLENWSSLAAQAAIQQDRIDKMEANSARFMAASTEVLTALKAADQTPWAHILHRLRTAQDAARDHAGLLERLEREERGQAEDKTASEALNTQMTQFAESLGGLPVGEDLAVYVARCASATELRQALQALTQDLENTSLPSPEEADPAALTARLSQRRAALTLARETTEAALAARIEHRSRIDAVGGDEVLARLASAKEALLEDIRSRAERHISHRFGLLAFDAALRRYRESHRSGMLARASDAFSRLGQGAYAGLDAQPDGARDVILARPASGGGKLTQDLSKGTRFQLYLALRIAGYHERAKTHPTVPFIADDIMETFDDGRSLAAFRLLGEMSEVGQVIYLTHHRHLCDLALEACPGAQIINLAE